MKHFLCALLLGSALLAQQQLQTAPDLLNANGTFYVEGIAYQFAIGKDYTVVAATHSVINHKFLAVKLRFYNSGPQPVTIKPEEVVVEDAIADHGLAPISAPGLANKMRKTYNMSRYAAGADSAIGGEDSESARTGVMTTVQYMDMMMTLEARAHGFLAVRQNQLNTDSPEARNVGAPCCPYDCAWAWRLQMRESQGTDTLAELQRSTSPDYVEQCSLRSNTIPPRANVSGVLYFPLGKLTQTSSALDNFKKKRIVRVTVPVGDEKFQFVLLVE